MVLCGVLATLAVGLQTRADAEQAAAPVVEASVVGHSDDGYTLEVRPFGASSTRSVETLTTADHPVGSRTAFWQFEDGSARLVAEPYDPWGATAGTGSAAALLLVALARRLRRRWLFRRFATRPQPLWRARARLLPGLALVYAVDAGPQDEPLLVLPLQMDEELDEDEVFVELPDLVDVRLAGEPCPGAWCAVATDDTWVGPAGPAEPGTGGPPVELPALDLDDEGIPVLAVPVQELAPGDVIPWDGPVTDRGEHRAPFAVAVLVVAYAGAMTVAVLGWVDEIVDGRVWQVVLAAGVGLVVLEVFWRFHLRPRLTWDSDGVVVVSATGPARRYCWQDVVDVEPAGRGTLELVLVTELDADLEFEDVRHGVICADPWLPPLLRNGWRTVGELRAVLLQARARRRGGRNVVGVSGGPSRPPALWVLWSLVVACAVLVGG